MLTKLSILTVLFAGLPLLAVALSPAEAQETGANASDQSRLRTWTDRSGTHNTEAAFMDLKVTLKKKDGTIVTIPLESLSDADRDYLKQKIWGVAPASAAVEEVRPAGRPKQRPSSAQHGRNVAEINPSGGRKASAISQAKEVVVTGVGSDSDKAMQNAFSQAIKQTVGVLVDAEIVVKNDQLIRDEILTYSRGYVEKYEIVKRWQEDGLHHATVRAVVARDKLVEKLTGMKIAVADVPGDLAGRQIEFDAKNEEQSAEILKKVLAEFDMTRLTKVEIVGKPEITRDGANAKVHVKVKLSPDITRWREFSKNLRQVLSKTATKRGAIAWRGNFDGTSNLAKQLAGQGVLVALFVNANNTGDRMD